MAAQSSLTRYARRDSARIEGWFSRIDAEIFRALLEAQNAAGLTGAVAEIGVHHGKSFLPLCLALQEGERALCIDLFDRQDQNVDASGHGDREIFLGHLTAFGVDLSRIDIVAGSSLDLSALDILQKVGRVRFFSVDGGHWRDLVENDLDLAAATLTERGIVALDDFLHKEWPEVTIGGIDWLRKVQGVLEPFALSDGKLYLAPAEVAKIYAMALLADPFLARQFNKNIDLLGLKIPLLNGADKKPLDKLNDWTRYEFPRAYNALRHIKRAVFGKADQ